MTIRNFTLLDFSRFLHFPPDEWSEAHSATAHSLLKQNPTERCVVAEEDAALVGYAYGFVLPNAALFIDFVYVTPARRRYGVATELIRALERSSGCREALVFFHRSLHGFYTRRGYETSSDLEAAVKPL